jgi:hypothetical protein
MTAPEQKCIATQVTFGSENRMSIRLPVPELWRENTSGLSKLDLFVTEGAQIAHDDQKQNCSATHVTFGSENRMSVVLPVGGKTLPVWPKLVVGAQIAQKIL